MKKSKRLILLENVAKQIPHRTWIAYRGFEDFTSEEIENLLEFWSNKSNDYVVC